MRPRVFVSHASEDKEAIARPLALALKDRGFDVWFDEFVLHVGDPLLDSIDRGLRECDFGVVILSKAFFSKSWPQRELAGLVAREMANVPMLLPIWHELTLSDVVAQSPILANRLAASSSEGLVSLVDRIVAAVRPRRGPWKNVSDTDFVIPLTISGKRLFELVENVTAGQHSVTKDKTAGRLRLFFYGDGSGIDETLSGFMLADGVDRAVTRKDILAILGEQPYVQWSYSVWDFGVEITEVPEDAFSPNEDAILVHDTPKVYFTAVIDQQYIRSDELVAFVTALVRFQGALPCDTQGALWWDRDSPGRSAVRRLSQTGDIHRIIELLQVDWNPDWKNRPHSDYRLFCLARSIIYELDVHEMKEPSAPIVQALLDDKSPLNEYWRKRLRDRLTGDPLWVHYADEFDFDGLDNEDPRFDRPPIE